MEKFEIMSSANPKVSVYKIDDDILINTDKFAMGFEEKHIKFFKLDKINMSLMVVGEDGDKHTFSLTTGDISIETPTGEVDSSFSKPMHSLPSKEEALATLKAMYPNATIENLKACLMK